jgi:DNA polymerase-3 subunit delta
MAPGYGAPKAVRPVCKASDMRGPTADEVLGRVTLVTGKEEFLSERTVVAVRHAVHRHDHEAELSETHAAGLSRAGLGELSAPSLFSATRCVVVRALENLPDESVDGLLEYAAAPAGTSPWSSCTAGGRRAAACSPSCARSTP